VVDVLAPPSRGEDATVIFKAVRDGRPYPDHGMSLRQWTAIPPSQVALDQLVTTKRVMDLGRVLDDDSTYFGDMFAHVVEWQGELFLEDGLHRALRCALSQRRVLHARVLRLPPGQGQSA
jgi:Arc/MetJ family transcription regulator